MRQLRKMSFPDTTLFEPLQINLIAAELQIQSESTMECMCTQLQNESPASSEDDIIQPGRGGSAACGIDIDDDNKTNDI